MNDEEEDVVFFLVGGLFVLSLLFYLNKMIELFERITISTRIPILIHDEDFEEV